MRFGGGFYERASDATGMGGRLASSNRRSRVNAAMRPFVIFARETIVSALRRRGPPRKGADALSELAPKWGFSRDRYRTAGIGSPVFSGGGPRTYYRGLLRDIGGWASRLSRPLVAGVASIACEERRREKARLEPRRVFSEFPAPSPALLSFAE